MARLVLAPRSRRSFLVSASLSLLALAAGCPAETPKDPDAEPDSDPGDTGGTTDSAGDTGDTSGVDTADSGADSADSDTGTTTETGDTSGVEEDPWGPDPTDCSTPSAETGTGPFYRAGAPERTDLNPLDEEGTTLRVYFRVVNTRCEPIAGCLVEVWHCAPEAEYDMTSDDYRFYGVQYTTPQGRGFIETIKPPTYVDDAGEHMPHIHFQLTAPGYRKIAFQCLFLEDGASPDDLNPVLDPVVAEDGSTSDSVVYVLAEEDAVDTGA